MLYKFKKLLKSIKKKQKKLNLEIFSEITGLEIPIEYRKMKKEQITQVTFSTDNIKVGAICFVINAKYIDEIKLRKYAKFVVTKTPIEGCNNIICEKPQKYGILYFKYLRDKYDVKSIGVTGSVGKTSTKDMIKSVLKTKYNDKLVVLGGNSNTTIKVSMAIKKLTDNTKVYLQEVGLGASSKVHLRYCAMMINADIAVYTNIKDCHIETYGSRKNILKYKSELSHYGKDNGIAIINYDDELLRNYEFKQKTLSYSLNNKNADYYAENIKITSTGTSFTIVDTIKNSTLNAKVNVIGEHHVLNAIVSYIVGKLCGVKNKEILTGLKAFKTSGFRQNLINLGTYKVFADCYNSSYDALSATLKSLDVMITDDGGKKIAVIGDILELGNISKEVHENVGKLISKYDFYKVLFIGEMSKYSYEEYKKNKDNAIYCHTRDELIEKLDEVISKNDIVLFKGSHGMRLYDVIDTYFGTYIGEAGDISEKFYNIEKDKEYEYLVFKNHTTINNYLGNSKKIKLPNKLKNIPVEKLGKEVFKDNNIIENIELSLNIKRIHNQCFSNSSLKKIKFNENMRIIGIGAFENCKNIKEIVLPEKLIMINSRAFSNCDNLRKIYIPEMTRSISSKAFEGSDNVVICCKENSYAKAYAQKYNIKFEIIK